MKLFSQIKCSKHHLRKFQENISAIVFNYCKGISNNIIISNLHPNRHVLYHYSNLLYQIDPDYYFVFCMLPQLSIFQESVHLILLSSVINT